MLQGDGVYTAEEFAVRARDVFGRPPETVTAAFKIAGKETATLEEAKSVLQKFLEKEIR